MSDEYYVFTDNDPFCRENYHFLRLYYVQPDLDGQALFDLLFTVSACPCHPREPSAFYRHRLTRVL